MTKHVRETINGFVVQKQSRHGIKAFSIGSFPDQNTAARMAQIFDIFIEHIPYHRYLAFSDQWPRLVESQIHLFRAVFKAKTAKTQKIIGNWLFDGFPLPPPPQPQALEQEVYAYVNKMIYVAYEELKILEANQEKTDE